MSSSLEACYHTLCDLLRQWKEVTQGESDCIRAEDWTGLDELQSRKTSMQEAIAEAETAFFSHPSLTPDLEAVERERFRKLAAELVSLEEQNRELLGMLLARADTELKSSDRTIRSLRHVQQAYGSSGNSFWQAYS